MAVKEKIRVRLKSYDHVLIDTAAHIGTTYRSLEKGAFNGCISLTGIYLYETDGNRIAPALTGLLDGASRSVKIYIPKDSNYVAGYSWSRYEDKFVTFSKEDNQ